MPATTPKSNFSPQPTHPNASSLPPSAATVPANQLLYAEYPVHTSSLPASEVHSPSFCQTSNSPKPSHPLVPLHLPTQPPYAHSNGVGGSITSQSANSRNFDELELRIDRQRVPLAMPHPEVPLSVQNQLLQASVDGSEPENRRKSPHTLPPVHIPPRSSLQMSDPLVLPNSPYSASNRPRSSHSRPVSLVTSNSVANNPNFSTASSASASLASSVAHPLSPNHSPRASASSPFNGVVSPSLGPGHSRLNSETKLVIGPQLTVDQFETVRRQAATQPHDPRAQLELARKLLEASDQLANYYEDSSHPSTREVDEEVQLRNRDEWCAQALKIAKHLARKVLFPDAMFLLGSVYSSRRYGVEMNYVKALEWYHKAAKLDHPEATNRIAVCEEFGVGTPRNVINAVNWYKRAAMLGSPGAMYKLGMLSMLGALEQPRNFETGLLWLQRAAERADHKTPHAVHELALLHEHSSLSTYVAGDPLVRNDSKALQLFFTAANLGYAPSQARLGRAFEFGELGCEVSPEHSVSWYSQAAQQGDSNGELALAGWFWTGAPQILKKNEAEAFMWAERAAQRGNTRALYCVGYFYETGTGVPADLKRAKRFYTLAAEKNHPRAVQKLHEIS